MFGPHFKLIFDQTLMESPPVKDNPGLGDLLKQNMVDIMFAVDKNDRAKDQHTILQKFMAYATLCREIFPFSEEPVQLPYESPLAFLQRHKAFTKQFSNYHCILSPFKTALFYEMTEQNKSGPTPQEDQREMNDFLAKTTLPHNNHLYHAGKDYFDRLHALQLRLQK